MSRIVDFNTIDDCDKIDAAMINAFVDFHFDPESETGLCLESSWGGGCLDLTDIVKAAETCTSLYLSPEDDPNCLVYNGECDDFCIHGDDLSRIISMSKLKDVDQGSGPSDGDVYMYDGATNTFKTFDLKTALGNINTTLQNLNATINNLSNRLTAVEGDITSLKNRVTAIEAKLTPPEDAPSDAKVVFGNINLYSDPNVVIDESTGTPTSLNKNRGLYTHLLSENKMADEVFG